MVDSQLAKATMLCGIWVSRIQLQKIHVRKESIVVKIYVRIYHVISRIFVRLHAKGDE